MKPAAFLDRDGTILVDKGYMHDTAEIEFIDGAIDGLRVLKELGYLLVVITNQSGIARGYFTEDDYRRFSSEFSRRLRDAGVVLDAIYHCPHLSGCHCRKPETGLFYQAADELGIDFAASVAIGDRERDLSICDKEAVRGILLSENSDGKFESYPSLWIAAEVLKGERTPLDIIEISH